LRIRRDVAASVRQRLLNKAKESNRPFQEVLQYFVMERFLYRLSQSTHSGKFVLKGALMLTAWRAPSSRATKDIDFLARMKNAAGDVAAVIADVCNQNVEDDGVMFDPRSINARSIKEDADYAGVRVTFLAKLQNARIAMQIDMGFGDVVTPEAVKMEYPTILPDLAAPILYGYNRETVVAEKFEAMVKLSLLNSRMKDFYDIWLLSQQFDFDGARLHAAISSTFSHRRTDVVEQPAALTTAFTEDDAKRKQWTGFLKRSRIEIAPIELRDVAAAISVFLVPVAVSILAGTPFKQTWRASGPWQSISQVQ